MERLSDERLAERLVERRRAAGLDRILWKRIDVLTAEVEAAKDTSIRMGDAIYEAAGSDWKEGNVATIKWLRAEVARLKGASGYGNEVLASYHAAGRTAALEEAIGLLNNEASDWDEEARLSPSQAEKKDAESRASAVRAAAQCLSRQLSKEPKDA